MQLMSSVISHIIVYNALMARVPHTLKMWPLISLHFPLKTGSALSFFPYPLVGFPCAAGADVRISDLSYLVLFKLMLRL